MSTSTVDFLSKEGVATLWQTIKDYAVAKELLAQPSGVATLDEFGKVLQTQLPDYILGQVLFGGTIDGNGVATLTTLFKNRYNLSVATLDVDNLTAANYEGSYFIATANGVSGIAKTLDIVVGDWVISNGSEWTKIDNTDAVRTVLGLKGDIQAPDLRNAMLGKSGNQGTNLALGDIWMGNGDGTVVTHRTSIFARSILASIAENTMFAKLWADRATNDGNGKNIANTYMPFAGGIFTGDVTHNANLILTNSKVIVGKDTSGSNISLLSLNSSNQVVIAYGAHNKYDTLIYGNRLIAYGDICGQKGVSAKGIADFGVGGSSGGNGGAHYDLLIDQKTDRVTLQLKGDDGDIDTKDMLAFSTTRAGIIPKAPSAGSVLRGNGWGTLAFSELASKPTTLGGYGITDAYTKTQIENGVFPNMRVGLADDLGDIEETLDEEYTFQPTANPNEIRDGYAQIESLKGNSLVWNQQIRNSSVKGTISSKSSRQFNDIKYVVGHYYIIQKTQSFSSDSVYFQTDGVVGLKRIGGSVQADIFRCDMEVLGKPYIYNGLTTQLDIDGYFAIRDLTQMFGEGYEPTTVEEFERRCPKGMPMDYNEGEVIHFNGDIKSVGFNQWDEEWEVGVYSSMDGNVMDMSNRIRCKNAIRVMPNATYYIICRYNANNMLYFYDESDNYLGLSLQQSINNGVFTTPSTAAYMRFNTASGYGETYNHDICINLSDPDKNGTYEPYTEFVRDLPTELFEGGMKSAGTVHDEIYWDKAKGKYIKVTRIGKVDLGTLSWAYATNGATSFRSATLQDAKRINSDNIVANIICSRYELGTALQVYSGSKSISLYPTEIWIYDTSFGSDVAAFKAAMSGVMLYYELAEPIVEEIDIPYMDYQVSNDGTEEIVSDVPTTPVKARVTYNFDTVGTVRQNRFDISTIRSEGVAKLKTSRTIWGQSFDGSGDVSGAMSGVTNINSTLYLSSSGNVGIGTTNPQYKLDVNGSFRATSGEIKDSAGMPLVLNTSSTTSVILNLQMQGSNKVQLGYNTTNGVFITSPTVGRSLGITPGGTPIFYDGANRTLLHSGNTKLTLDPAYNWEDKNSQTNKQVYGFTLNVNGTEIGMSAITKEELEEMLR